MPNNNAELFTKLLLVFRAVLRASAQFYFPDDQINPQQRYYAEAEYLGLIHAVCQLLATHDQNNNPLIFLKQVGKLLIPFDSRLTAILAQRISVYLDDIGEDTATELKTTFFSFEQEVVQAYFSLNSSITDLLREGRDAELPADNVINLINDSARWYQARLTKMLQGGSDKLLFGLIDYSMPKDERFVLLLRKLLASSNSSEQVAKIWRGISQHIFLWSIRDYLMSALNVFCCYEGIRKSELLASISQQVHRLAAEHVEFVPLSLFLNTDGVSLASYSVNAVACSFDRFASDLNALVEKEKDSQSIGVKNHLAVHDDRLADLWCSEYLLLMAKAFAEALTYYRRAEKQEDVERIESELIQICRYIKQHKNDPEVIQRVLAILTKVIPEGADLSLLHLVRYEISDKEILLPPLLRGEGFMFYSNLANVVLDYIRLIKGQAPTLMQPDIKIEQMIDFYLLLLQPNVIFLKSFMTIMDEGKKEDDENDADDGDESSDDDFTSDCSDSEESDSEYSDDEESDNKSAYTDFITPIFGHIFAIGGGRFLGDFEDLNYPKARLVYYVLRQRGWDGLKDAMFRQATEIFIEWRKNPRTPVTDLTYRLVRERIASYYRSDEGFGLNEELADFWTNLAKAPSIENHLLLAEYYVRNVRSNCEIEFAYRIAHRLMQWVLSVQSPLAEVVTAEQCMRAQKVLADIFEAAEKSKVGNASKYGYRYKGKDGRSEAADAFFEVTLQRVDVNLATVYWQLLAVLLTGEKNFLEQNHKNPSEDEYPVRLVALQKNLQLKRGRVAWYCEKITELIAVCNYFKDHPFSAEQITADTFSQVQKLGELCGDLSKVYDFSLVRMQAWSMLHHPLAEEITEDQKKAVGDAIVAFIKERCVSGGKLESEPELFYGLLLTLGRLEELSGDVFTRVSGRLRDTLINPKSPILLRQRTAQQLALLFRRQVEYLDKELQDVRQDDEDRIKTIQSSQEKINLLAEAMNKVAENSQYARFPFPLLQFAKDTDWWEYEAKVSPLLQDLFAAAVSQAEQFLVVADTEYASGYLEPLLSYYGTARDAGANECVPKSNFEVDEVINCLQNLRQHPDDVAVRGQFILYLRSLLNRYRLVDDDGYVGGVKDGDDSNKVHYVYSIMLNKFLAHLLAEKKIAVSIVQVQAFNQAARALNGICWSGDELLCLLELSAEKYAEVKDYFIANLDEINRHNRMAGVIYGQSSHATSMISLSGKDLESVQKLLSRVQSAIKDVHALKEVEARFITVQKFRKLTLELLAEVNSSVVGRVINNMPLVAGVEASLVRPFLVRVAWLKNFSAGDKDILRGKVEKYLRKQRLGGEVTRIVAICQLRAGVDLLQKELQRLDNFYHLHTDISGALLGNTAFVPQVEIEERLSGLYLTVEPKFEFNWVGGRVGITIPLLKTPLKFLGAKQQELSFYLISSGDGKAKLIIPLSNSHSLSRREKSLLDRVVEQFVALNETGTFKIKTSPGVDSGHQVYVEAARSYLQNAWQRASSGNDCRSDLDPTIHADNCTNSVALSGLG